MRFHSARGVLVAIACAVSLTHAAQKDVFDEIYERGKPIEAGLKTLTAEFTETSTSSLLARPIVSKGSLAVVRPSQVLLSYSDEGRRLVINGDVLRVLWPARKLDQKSSIGAAQRRIQRYFVDKSPAQLRNHFDITATTAADRAGSWRVVMTPKRRQIKEGLSRLELWINQDSVVLEALRMTFPNGDTKLMEFFNVAVNPPVDPELFK